MTWPATRITAIGFDADDTLWQNETFFRMTEQRFTELLSDHGEHHVISARLLEAERRNLQILWLRRQGLHPVDDRDCASR